jgi:hypothetical protein
LPSTVVGLSPAKTTFVRLVRHLREFRGIEEVCRAQMLVAGALAAPLSLSLVLTEVGIDRKLDVAFLRGAIERKFARELVEATMDRREPEMVDREQHRTVERIDRIRVRRDGGERNGGDDECNERLPHDNLRCEWSYGPRGANHAARMGRAAARSAYAASTAARTMSGACSVRAA